MSSQPTPLPWAVWKLSPDSDPQQRHIIVTADGEQEITGIVHREADARHIVRCVNAQGRLLAALYHLCWMVSLEKCKPHVQQAIRSSQAAIAETTGSSSLEPRKPVVIEVWGGMVQEVLNVPPGYEYEVKDYDTLEAGEELASETARLNEPTNRDRAGWARAALAVFTDLTFSGDDPDTMDPNDLESAIGDLICDLMHLAFQQGFDPQKIVETAQGHHAIEIMGATA